MLQYSYNNITIIVTNVIHPGALLPFYLFYQELEHKSNES